MRIQRALARAGVASRRHAEELVAAGRVRVNGAPASIGQTVNPASDEITVDGRKIVTRTQTVWIVLNKPRGVLTTAADPSARKTVFDLVEKHAGLTYVGRLDYLTEGVLLLTTDGTAAHRLTHPSAEVPRTYEALVRGDAARAVRIARGGVELDDGLVEPLDVEAAPLGRGRWLLTITVSEGRNREIRRTCEALGLEIERLVRTRFGPVNLGSLAPGASRALTPSERRHIAALTSERRPKKDVPARGKRHSMP